MNHSCNQLTIITHETQNGLWKILTRLNSWSKIHLRFYEMLICVGCPCGFCPKILIECKSKVMHMFDEQNNQHRDES